MSEAAKVVIVVLDGLRPDMVTPELMPHLDRFRARGAWFRESRSVFPSVTRVCTTSLATGSPPGVHGVVSNNFFDPRVFPAEVLDTGRRDHLEAAVAAYGGRFVTAPSLGERVAAAGRRMVAVHSGSPGSAFLLNHRVAANGGHATFSVHGAAASTPPALFEEVVARFGPVPPAAVPNSPRVRYAARVFAERVLGEERPDVAALWFSDPDTSYHYARIGSAETRGALRVVDEAFGRILDWWDHAPGASAYRLFAVSDHAQITAHTQIDLLGALRAAGFAADLRLAGDGALGLTLGY
ncbi:MAG TPA: nucleotide pyrophosphatase/phosphodiesterase family protein, partial [Geminicoccaceae bacterium]|nr:nucleotide pyrophosphatase/phosphodiesterase family protein [Geminicoccaceae bacterium]